MSSEAGSVLTFEETDLGAITWVSQLTQTCHRSLYPLLDPREPHLSAVGKTVLITGVSGGIGRAIAEAWTIAGAKGIVITARRAELLRETEARLNQIGQGNTKVVVIPADVTRDEDVAKLWREALATIGSIDVLINNAGSLTEVPAGEGEPESWWRDFVR